MLAGIDRPEGRQPQFAPQLVEVKRSRRRPAPGLEHHDRRQQGDLQRLLIGNLAGGLAVEDAELQFRPLLRKGIAAVSDCHGFELLRRAVGGGTKLALEQLLAGRDGREDLLLGFPAE